jgi:hypothetical protein
MGSPPAPGFAAADGMKGGADQEPTKGRKDGGFGGIVETDEHHCLHS